MTPEQPQPLYLVVKSKKTDGFALYRELSKGYGEYSFYEGSWRRIWSVSRKWFLQNYSIILSTDNLREAQTFLIEEQFKSGDMASALLKLSRL